MWVACLPDESVTVYTTYNECILICVGVYISVLEVCLCVGVSVPFERIIYRGM
jgi:hypothetical protein